MILLTFRSHSEKPWQKCHPKRPSDKTIAHSAQVRLATNLYFATHLAGQRMLCDPQSDLRCASPSAHESGIFELLGSCTPLAYLFFAVKKKSVAARRRHRRSQRIKGNKRRFRTKRFRRATHDPYVSLFLIPHSSLNAIFTGHSHYFRFSGLSPLRSSVTKRPSLRMHASSK